MKTSFIGKNIGLTLSLFGIFVGLIALVYSMNTAPALMVAHAAEGDVCYGVSTGPSIEIAQVSINGSSTSIGPFSPGTPGSDVAFAAALDALSPDYTSSVAIVAGSKPSYSVTVAVASGSTDVFDYLADASGKSTVNFAVVICPDVDTDGDGTPDVDEKEGEETDPCLPSDKVSACDTDEDGVPDGDDPAPEDPCDPNACTSSSSSSSTGRTGKRVRMTMGNTLVTPPAGESCYFSEYSTERNPASSKEVTKIQEFLNEKTGMNIAVDGKHGPETSAAIARYQEMNKKAIADWKGHLSGPTGNWMYTTRNIANEAMGCEEGDIALPFGATVS